MGRMDRALHRGARRALKAKGGPATLEPISGATPLDNVTASIARDVEFTEGETQTLMQRDEVAMLVEEVGGLQQGDLIFDENGTKWKVVQPLANNGFIVRAAVLEYDQ